MIKPLSPKEIIQNKIEVFPPEMVKAVNNLLLKKFNGSRIGILQKDIVDEFHRLTNNVHVNRDIYDNHWMDFESIFQNVGWKVEYDKPGYNETGEARFYFSAKNAKS